MPQVDLDEIRAMIEKAPLCGPVATVSRAFLQAVLREIELGRQSHATMVQHTGPHFEKVAA